MSSSKLVSIQPFNLPMILKNSVKQRFTLLMVLKLTDEDERDYVLSRVTIHGPKPNL